MNRKQRRSRASQAGANTKALMRRERERLNSAPANAMPSGLSDDTGLIERVPHGPMTMMLNAVNPYLRFYSYGQCSVIVTRAFGHWQLSVSHPTRYPTWLEISGAWYKAIPDSENLTAVLILPLLGEYVNIHSFCMQVRECPPEDHWDLAWAADRPENSPPVPAETAGTVSPGT